MSLDLNPAALQVANLSKAFGDFKAVHDLTFNLERGKILGLVGANGAGKTTTLRCIAGMIRPSDGRVQICGHDLAAAPLEAKRRLAYIPDTVHPYDLLTVTEHLHFIALTY